MQTFHLIFTEPGKVILVQPCIHHMLLKIAIIPHQQVLPLIYLNIVTICGLGRRKPPHSFSGRTQLSEKPHLPRPGRVGPPDRCAPNRPPLPPSRANGETESISAKLCFKKEKSMSAHSCITHDLSGKDASCARRLHLTT